MIVVAEDKVKEIVCRISKIPLDKLSINDDLSDKYGIDSLKKVEIVIEIEKAFDLAIDDDTAIKLRTISQIIEFINAKSQK